MAFCLCFCPSSRQSWVGWEQHHLGLLGYALVAFESDPSILRKLTKVLTMVSPSNAFPLRVRMGYTYELTFKLCTGSIGQAFTGPHLARGTGKAPGGPNALECQGCFICGLVSRRKASSKDRRLLQQEEGQGGESLGRGLRPLRTCQDAQCTRYVRCHHCLALLKGCN